MRGNIVLLPNLPHRIPNAGVLTRLDTRECFFDSFFEARLPALFFLLLPMLSDTTVHLSITKLRRVLALVAAGVFLS